MNGGGELRIVGEAHGSPQEGQNRDPGSNSAHTYKINCVINFVSVVFYTG